MRLRIAHSSVYRYDPPAAGVIQVLRLTPRNHDGQYVGRWRIDVVPDARLAAHEDAFGNITHVFTADGPLEELRVEVDGEVETQNANGVVRGTVERFPPSLFLRDTALTQADGAIRDFAQTIRAASGGVVLAELHGLLDRLFEDIAGDAASPAPANAAEAFARKRGAPKDLAHIFIGAARSSASRPAMSAATIAAPTTAPRRTPATPGRKPMCPISAGSASIRPTAAARPTAMSASPSGSIRSAPRRCAARAWGWAPRLWPSPSKVDQ